MEDKKKNLKMTSQMLYNHSLQYNSSDANNFHCFSCINIPIIKLKTTSNNVIINYTCENNHSGEMELTSYLKKIRATKKKVLCDYCKKQQNDLSYCPNCDKYICEQCKFFHQNEKCKLLKIEEIGILCPIDHQIIFGYCEDCKTKLCNYCSGHNGHKKIILNDVMFNKNKLDYIRNIIVNAENELNNIENLKKKIIDFFEQQKKTIK
jgi:hypothetical protein